MVLKPKFTETENELMGVVRPLIAADKKSVDTGDVLAPGLEEKSVAVNADAVANIEHLIRFAQVEAEKTIGFDEAERKAMLGEKADWKAYGEHFLGVDETKPEGTRMRYMYAVVKDGRVYTKELVKAAGSEHREVAQAAWLLCKAAAMVPAEQGSMKPVKSDMSCPVMATGRSCPMNSAGRCAHLSDGKDCKLQMDGMACALVDSGQPACPLMAGGEGCPMDTWSGCAQLDADGGCKLQDDSSCCMAKADAEDGEE